MDGIDDSHDQCSVGPQSKKARLCLLDSAAKDGTDEEDERQTKRRRCGMDAISACGIEERGKSPVELQSESELSQDLGREVPLQFSQVSQALGGEAPS